MIRLCQGHIDSILYRKLLRLLSDDPGEEAFKAPGGSKICRRQAAYVISKPELKQPSSISTLTSDLTNHVESIFDDRDDAREFSIRHCSRASLPLSAARDLDHHLRLLSRSLAPLEYVSTRLRHTQSMCRTRIRWQSSRACSDRVHAG